jgi:hypothetical protein
VAVAAEKIWASEKPTLPDRLAQGGSDLRWAAKKVARERELLREHATIVAAVDRLWVCLTDYAVPAEGKPVTLGKARYLAFSVMLHKLVLPPVQFNIFEADTSARGEWARDAKPRSHFGEKPQSAKALREGTAEPELAMGLNEFHDSMFELADIWCADRVSSLHRCSHGLERHRELRVMNRKNCAAAGVTRWRRRTTARCCGS